LFFSAAGSAIFIYPLELVGIDESSALHPSGCWLEWSVRQIFGVALGCRYGIGLVVFWAVRRVQGIGFWVQI
jgi:hypothetical protein